MLRRLVLKDFKAFADAEIAFEPLTILIGPNGSGKSTVLQAVELLGGLVRGTLQEHLGARAWEYEDLPNLLATNPRFSFETVIEDHGKEISWFLELGTRRRPGIAMERVTAEGEVLLSRKGRRMERVDRSDGQSEAIQQTLTSSWLSAIEPKADLRRFPELVTVAEWARGVDPYFFLDPWSLRRPSRKTKAGVGRGGETLAGFLRYLRDTDKAAFDRVIERVRKFYRRLSLVRLLAVRAGWTSIEVTETWGQKTAELTRGR